MMQIDVTHSGEKIKKKKREGKFNVRRDTDPRRQVNPRVTRLKIVRLCLYNQEKPTESINHNNPNLGALCALNNSSVYITLSSYLHSLAYVIYSSPAYGPTCSYRISSLFNSLLSANFFWGWGFQRYLICVP